MSGAGQWPPGLAEPALLAPPLEVSAVPVPWLLAPPLAVSAVPVPPEFGVETGGLELGGPAFAGLLLSFLLSVLSPVPAVVLCADITPWQ